MHKAGGVAPPAPPPIPRGRGPLLSWGLVAAVPFFLAGCVSDSERVGMASVDRTLAGAGELQLAAIKRLEEAGLAIVGRFELAGVVIVDRIFDRAEQAVEPTSWFSATAGVVITLLGLSLALLILWRRRHIARARLPPP